MIFKTKVIYKILNKFTYLVPKLLRLNYLYYINFFIFYEAEHEMYKLDKFIKRVMKENNLSIHSIGAFATIELYVKLLISNLSFPKNTPPCL